MRQPNSAPIKWDAFAKALATKQERRPQGEGWMTVEELIKKYKTSRLQVLRALKETPHETFKGVVMQNGILVRASWHRPT